MHKNKWSKEESTTSNHFQRGLFLYHPFHHNNVLSKCSEVKHSTYIMANTTNLSIPYNNFNAVMKKLNKNHWHRFVKNSQ